MREAQAIATPLNLSRLADQALADGLDASPQVTSLTRGFRIQTDEGELRIEGADAAVLGPLVLRYFRTKMGDRARGTAPGAIGGLVPAHWAAYVWPEVLSVPAESLLGQSMLRILRPVDLVDITELDEDFVNGLREVAADACIQLYLDGQKRTH